MCSHHSSTTTPFLRSASHTGPLTSCSTPTRHRTPMASGDFAFAEEELVVDQHLGYPRAYARLCGDPSLRFGPYGKGPPCAFYPYALHTKELIKAKDLNQMFPIIDPEAKPSENPNNFLNHLWKQLSHLGNAGFNPELFRVDMYGNVLYFYADHASPLSWDIDHWFPCSRGGRTMSSNLRLLQWQVCKRKHNRLEFLIPWWDLQLGISVNQFLSIFASKNSDFRKRAFSFLFEAGGNEELNSMGAVESYKFPPEFNEKNRQVGLAPAAISQPQRQQGFGILKPLASPRAKHSSSDGNRLGLETIKNSRRSISKENENPNMDGSDAYMSIALARDSLRQRADSKRIAGEIVLLEDEMEAVKHKNECERLAIQELEMLLVKKRKRVEKSRRLSEAQNSYRELLEKMIRDAMHQNVVYKEHLRLNQAATGALMARLEAQRAMCDASEKELHKKHKERDVIESRIRLLSETARKRSRMDDDDGNEEEEPSEARQDEAAFCALPVDLEILKPTRKELRQFLEEEQRAYAAELAAELAMADAQGEEMEEEEASTCERTHRRANASSAAFEERRQWFSLPLDRVVKDDKKKEKVGKDNIDKWLRMLLENAREEGSSPSPDLSPPKRIDSGNKTDEFVRNLNHRNPQVLRLKAPSEREGSIFNCNGKLKTEKCDDNMSEEASYSTSHKGDGCSSKGSSKGNNKLENLNEGTATEASKRRGMVRSASAGTLRSRPSSPSLIPAISSKLFKVRSSATKRNVRSLDA